LQHFNGARIRDERGEEVEGREKFYVFNIMV